MKFEYHKGDLIASNEGVIAHGCNTDGVMGAGIAKTIADKYTEMFWVYRDECKNRRFVPGTAMRYRYLSRDNNRLIFNLGTQMRPGADARYEFVYLSFRNMAEQMIALACPRVAIPKIGCGIGGLTWEVTDGDTSVHHVISEAMRQTEQAHHLHDFFTVAVYEL